jgi:subtilisin-like proprotein convertase family protein/subtilisin family serine protease
MSDKSSNRTESREAATPEAASSGTEIYTYRDGKRVPLTKRPDQFVIRASPEAAAEAGWTVAEQVSPHSTRVTTSPPELDAAMVRARAIAPTHHAYDVAATGQEFLITDRVFVIFRTAPSQLDLSSFMARYGLVLLRTYADREFLFQVTDHTGMNPVKLVVRLNEQEPLVERADHDLNLRVFRRALALPTDVAYAQEWHLHEHFSDPAVDPRSSSRCEGAWQALNHFGSADVVVGVTDDGCRLDHGDFNSPGKFAGWGYFEGNTLVIDGSPGADPTKMYQPGANHGTACAGVIAAEADAALTVGAAPGCRLLPIKWESSGPSLLISDSKFRAALDFMVDKVDVVSNSWGNSPDMTFSTSVLNRMRQLSETGGRRGRGIVSLFAAGNENCPIQHTGTLDIPFTDGWNPTLTGWIGVETSRVFEHNLTTIPGVMHVAALASHAQRSHYSNYGTGIGLCAPSNNVHEYRRMPVTGLGITTARGTQITSITDTFGGTSSATPLVAGIAALVISANPDLTALEVIGVLKQTAGKDLDTQAYPRTPPAPFDTDTSWDISPAPPFANGAFQNINSPDGTWSPWFGHGRVDAQAAVAEAIRRRAPSQPGLRRASSPDLVIPDNVATGVRDSIAFTEAGRVSQMTVSVDITHSFIGDLVVTLASPSGRLVTLHNRNGGNTANLNHTYRVSDTPQLGSLAGEPLAGQWTLSVVDAAPIDVGRLNRWELEATLVEPAAVELEDAPGLSIPDNDAAGIERTLMVTATGAVRDVTVGVDITHTFIGDLEVSLVPPAGATVNLHQRTGGEADNLVATFTAASVPGLSALRGQPMQGPWKLKVADRDRVDTGKLNRWSLRIDRQ